MKNKRVALVLGAGGARGMAHIGAIEELLARGYEISSIAGTSIGSMIAGMYAAGKLQEAKEWFLEVDRQTIFSMVDINITDHAFVKGERIIEELKNVVPDHRIEDLPIPCSIVAADLISSDEVIFTRGSLFEAIRASISIPLFFHPVQRGKQLLVDGGIVNPLPLNRVIRNQGELLVAMNISGKDAMHLKKVEKSYLSKAAELLSENGFTLPEPILHLKARLDQRQSEEQADLSNQVTYLSMADRMSDIQLQQNTQLMLQLFPPDIHAMMPQYAYTTFDFDKTADIIEQGRILMRMAINQYEEHLSLL